MGAGVTFSESANGGIGKHCWLMNSGQLVTRTPKANPLAQPIAVFANRAARYSPTVIGA